MNQESFEEALRRLTPREPGRAVRKRLFGSFNQNAWAELISGLWLRRLAPAACLALLTLVTLSRPAPGPVASASAERFPGGFIRLAPWSEPMSVPGVDVVRRNAVWPTFASTNLMGTPSSRGFSEMMVTEFVTR